MSKRFQEKRAVGIDIGVTKTAVGAIDSQGRLWVLAKPQQKATISSNLLSDPNTAEDLSDEVD